ncbi:MAG: type II secretion system secretin GspD [Pseudohongiellaceae bacterium]
MSALAALTLLLGSCAIISGKENAAGTVSNVPGSATTTINQTEVVATTLTEPTGTNSADLAAAISREGRVIQLGQFVEATPPVVPPENNVVELNYEQEDLRLVFEQLGTALNLNMVIDPTIDTKVSLRTSTNNPLRYADIWPLMRLLARNAGVTIEQAGNVYEFSRNTSAIPTELVLPAQLDAASSSEVLQITPLTYISIEAAETILAPLLQPAGSIIRLGPANLLGISAAPEQLSRINALLAVIDDDPFQNQGIHLYQLLNSRASEVAAELTSVLQLIEGEQSSYQVLGLDRINAVMVLAPAERGFSEVTRWVEILDAESQEQVEQLFVYKVKNLNAVTLADTLTSVFGNEEEVAGQAERTAVSDLTDPNSPFNQPIGVPTITLVAADVATTQSTAVSANITVAIVADEDTNSLLVRATPREYRQLLTTINTLDAVPPQVLINAVIGQVTLTDGTQFGIDWTRVSSNIASGPARLSASFLPSLVRDATGQVAARSGLLLTKTFMDGSAEIDATLNAIAQDNDVRLLARPTILAANNQEGEIKVGQAVPVNNGTTQSGNGLSTENIAYRDVGIVLTITPQINADGYINLEIFQSLSSIEGSGGGGVAGNPTFANQEITTTVVVSDQSTITLGGLIQEQTANQNTGVPYLQKIPLLGGLFSYQDNQLERRELFVILRPQIIRSDSSDAAVLQEFRDKFINVGILLEAAGL